MKVLKLNKIELKVGDRFNLQSYPAIGLYEVGTDLYLRTQVGVFYCGLLSQVNFENINENSESKESSNEMLLKTIALLTDKAKLSEII